MTAPVLPRPDEGPPASRAVPCAAGMGSLFVFAVSANALPAVVLRAAHTLGVTPERLATVASAQFGGFFLATAVGLTVAVGALGVVAAPPFMRFVLANATADAAFAIAAVPLLAGSGLMTAMFWRRGCA